MNRLLRKLPLLSVALIVAAALAYGFWPTSIRVDVAEVARGMLQVTVEEDGKTRIREKYVVSAPVAGKLMRVELEPGDPVQQGRTVLARIEPREPTLLDARSQAEAEARVRAAEATLEQTAASLERYQEALNLADDDYRRALELQQNGAISQAEFDRAEHQQRIATADLRSAEFRMKVANFELDLVRAALLRSRPADSGRPREADGQATTMTILSPVNGRVLRVLKENAGIVASGSELLEIGDPRDLEMEIDVLSNSAVAIRPGAQVIVEQWGGEAPLSGRVRLVEPSAFLKVSALGVEEQRVNVIADFIDPLSQRETLGDGYRVEARIVVDEAKDVLLTPAGVLFRDRGQWSAFQVVDNRARLRRLEIGRSNGRESEILRGAAPGDVFVMHPTDKLYDGAPVRLEQLHAKGNR